MLTNKKLLTFSLMKILEHRKELREEVKRLRSERQTACLNYRSIVVKRRRDQNE